LILLDENVIEPQRALLQKWRIPVRQIGVDVANKGIKDENMIPLLLQLPLPTLFSSDADFFNPKLCHKRYCIVFLAVDEDETATYVRLVLKHPAFKTRKQRLGTVSRVSLSGITTWRLNSTAPIHHVWGREN